MEKGLYVLYLANDHAHPVHDRNGESRGGGKLLIHPRGCTLKIGKFHSGFLQRRCTDARHLHRRAPRRAPAGSAVRIHPAAPGTFAECLRFAHVLDLTEQASDEAVIRAERALRKDMDRFLAEKGIEVEGRRGDYRLLGSPVSPSLEGAAKRWSRSALGLALLKAL